MYIDDHGGGCCGITHVYAFRDPVQRNIATLDRHIRTWRENMYRFNDFWENATEKQKTRFNVILEATLTDQQMTAGWAPIMKERGFKLVNRFKNSNSGNYVNVLHYAPAEPRGRNRTKPPYQW